MQIHTQAAVHKGGKALIRAEAIGQAPCSLTSSLDSIGGGLNRHRDLFRICKIRL